MLVDVKAPSFAESISEARIGNWVKKEGDLVERDEVVVELETDKAALEIVAPVSGKLARLAKQEGEPVVAGDVLAQIEEGPVSKSMAPEKQGAPPAQDQGDSQPHIMPAARREMAQQNVALKSVAPTGPGGRVLKEDVQKAARPAAPDVSVDGRQTESVPMTLIRKKIAQRLVEAQQSAALLTTFNECDMSAVLEARKEYQDAFTKKHGIKLGFMSFFVKAAVDALRNSPVVNARIDGDNIIYHNYQDIGVAVGGGKGLVVPVLRSAERLSFSEIEKQIADLANRAAENKIRPDELEGGTFTISNGGIYGSMLSTPIVNPPQSAILGLHAITERAVVRDGQVVARPMMNLALTYDHRIIDGREAVTFLKRIKDTIESPVRILLEV